jgi:DNA-binding GntR family transcriptional regulator
VLGITLEDLVDIMSIREHAEGLAAYYATQNRTEDYIRELKTIAELQDFYYGKKDLNNLQKMDDRFHDTIYELTGSAVLYDTLLPLHKKTQRFRKISIQDTARVPKSVGEHHAIFEAIAAGNAELAEELMNKHITNAKNSMIARLKDHG